MVFQSCQFGRPENALFCDNTSDQIRRGYIECRIPTGDTLRSDPMITNMRHLPVGPLFDFDIITADYVHIDGREGRSDVERHVVVFCQHGDLISADFIRCVAI